jgi:competence protein ComEA
MLRALAILAVLALPVVAQDDLPDSPGKATTVRVCTNCHGIEMFAGSHKVGNDWDQIIATMSDKGTPFSDADYAAVLDYLSSCLGPASSKVNVNKAAVCELARVLSITTAQAEAITAYRTKNGEFKDLDGLKKVDGIDAAALDAKKAVISF